MEWDYPDIPVDFANDFLLKRNEMLDFSYTLVGLETGGDPRLCGGIRLNSLFAIRYSVSVDFWGLGTTCMDYW